ncbi:hypothetical protein [Pseudomarimonas arenosa]|uniref:SWIM-type domain-containing protein n=1 Tax=Pseudomarimonas arenosa TaxID=2774145 RepID=A0AAW3ZIK6_9GAMM|nr:hypothetical protein [Pseudomarimonas arenosa]MBD8525260.1 hypothetical protein [Pseudomarimonas arenosa]
MKIELSQAEDIRGRRFAIVGTISHWPRFHPAGPEATIRARGGSVQHDLSPPLDYAVIGKGRMKGKAELQRKAEALAQQGQLQILDEAGLAQLMRPSLTGKRFSFCGELDFGRGASATGPAALTAAIGAEAVDQIDAELDFLVVGERRAKGKAAALAAAERLRAAGAKLQVMQEAQFMDLLVAFGGAAADGASQASPLAELVAALPALSDSGRIKRALDMLRTSSMQLYADVHEDAVSGIIRSQTGFSDYYSTRLAADGQFSCCDSSLDWCMGMQGAVCKHLLALLLGLVQSGQLSAATARDWLSAAKPSKSRRRADTSDDVKQLLADTILRFKAAEAGELDWRPTETVPEDFYV